MRTKFRSTLIVPAFVTVFIAAVQAAEAPPSPVEPRQHSPAAVSERPVVPAIPKVYSTTPAGLLLLSMDTAQSEPVIGWPFSACTNEFVQGDWDGYAVLKGTSTWVQEINVFWLDSPDSGTPPCPSGQVRRKYYVWLEGQPDPGDYEVKLGPSQPGTVLVPLTLRVPSAAYRQNFMRRLPPRRR